VELRFYIDPESGEPHIYEHNVVENEVAEILARPLEDRHAGWIREWRWDKLREADTCA
jgi:hypothetical protein